MSQSVTRPIVSRISVKIVPTPVMNWWFELELELELEVISRPASALHRINAPVSDGGA